MKTQRLLPSYFKIIGTVLSLISISIGISKILGSSELLKMAVVFCFYLGGMLIILSREKKEDEFIDSLRLQSFRSAVIFVICMQLVNILLYATLGWEIKVYERIAKYGWSKELFMMMYWYLFQFNFALYTSKFDER